MHRGPCQGSCVGGRPRLSFRKRPVNPVLKYRYGHTYFTLGLDGKAAAAPRCPAWAGLYTLANGR